VRELDEAREAVEAQQAEFVQLQALVNASPDNVDATALAARLTRVTAKMHLSIIKLLVALEELGKKCSP
jgi:predicted amino acid-binding ACT domain protein